MASGFFGSYGERIDFHDAAGLAAKLAEMDLAVPRRREGRRSQHRERWCLARYLVALSDAALLRFPLSVEKGKSPDVMLSYGEEATGLEITEAGPEKHQRAMTAAESMPAGTRLYARTSWCYRVSPSNHVHPTLGTSLSASGPRSSGATSSARPRACSGSGRLPRHHLLIYDNTHLNIVSSMAAECLASELGRWNQESPDVAHRFSLISVLLGSPLLYDVNGTARLLTVTNPAAGGR